MSERKTHCNVRGFVFDTARHENPGNTPPTNSGYRYHVTESGSFMPGKFSMSIASLKPGTTYYFWACAHNLAGWSYGDEENFTTKKKGVWRKVTSYLGFDAVEVGFPSGVKVKLRRQR